MCWYFADFVELKTGFRILKNSVNLWVKFLR